MDLSNCICYNKRKKGKSVKDYKKDKSMGDYENKMKVISSPQILSDGNLVKYIYNIYILNITYSENKCFLYNNIFLLSVSAYVPISYAFFEHLYPSS